MNNKSTNLPRPDPSVTGAVRARQSRASGEIEKYIARGWAFTPLNGKMPLRKAWQTENPLPVEKLRQYDGNIGLRTGQASGIVVIDFDEMDCLEDYAERLPETVEAISGGGGRHFYYRYTKPAKCKRAGKVLNGADIKADGGCIVFPGSRHPESGSPYRWAPGHSPDEIELAPLPSWIVEKIQPLPPKPRPATVTRRQNGNGTANYCAAALADECEAVRSAVVGTRNDTLNKAAHALGGFVTSGHLNRDTVVGELLAAALTAGLPEPEARATIRSGLTSGEANPREIPERESWTFGWGDSKGGTCAAADLPKSDPAFIEYPLPMELARHFIEHRFTKAGELHLIRHAGDWYRYNGVHWALLEDEHIAAQVARHFDSLWTPKRDRNGAEVKDDAGNPVNVKVRNTRNTVGECLFAAKACGPLVSRDPPCWLPSGDIAVNVIPCRNGLLDVQTGELKPLTAGLFCTWGLDIEYQPDASEPRELLSFLSQLFDDDPDSIATLQEMFGLALTADSHYQKIFLIYGPKRSGKGTIARVLTAMLGKVNVASPTLGSLATQFGLQPLIGKLLAIISDARLSNRIDQTIVVERLLNISGEDAQTIDRKHRDPVTLTLPTRILILTNELPRLADSSGAMASRFIVVKLTKSFYGQEDYGLTARLLAELPSILNWSILGLRRLKARGRFIQPERALEDIAELETLGSPVAAFVNECCTVAPGQTITVKGLFGAWQDWCKDAGRDHTSDRAVFARNLRAAFPGIVTKQRREGGSVVRIFEGISYGKA